MVIMAAATLLTVNEDKLPENIMWINKNLQNNSILSSNNWLWYFCYLILFLLN